MKINEIIIGTVMKDTESLREVVYNFSFRMSNDFLVSC